MTRPDLTLGDLVIDHPEAARLFERLGLDYCCGGRRSLEKACAERGLDPATVLVTLEALGEETAGERHDIADASIADLCEHIVTCHHDRLRSELPRISELAQKVGHAHGAERSDLLELRDVFTATRAELESHMRLEETELFPGCRALDANPGDGDLSPDLLAQLEDTHAQTGEALHRLRELGGDFRPDSALCATHRALLQALAEFELDLHQHVHEENNVLFARVRERITPSR